MLQGHSLTPILLCSRSDEYGRIAMTTRRDAMKAVAGGLVFVGCGLHGVAHAQTAAPKAKRRETVIAGKRVKTVDIHAHCAVPEALALTGQKLGGPSLRPDLDMATEVA